MSDREDDMLYVLYHKHRLFNDYKNEVISLLQAMVLPLLDKDMLLLCLLEWLLDEECNTIEGIPTNVMIAMTTEGRGGVWLGFLPTMFVKWV